MVILYIEDDDDDVVFFQEALVALGMVCNVLTARNGKLGLAMLAEMATPDFIFLDINMPIMDGNETLRNIRQNSAWQNIPVIMLSTAIVPADDSHYAAVGANACLTKPVNVRDLTTIIDKIVRHRQFRQF